MKLVSFAQIPRVRELMGILCLVAFLAVVLSLATFDPADPSWNTASPADPPHNAIGRVGASVADLGYQSFGLSIWLLPAVLLVAGWRSLKLRPVGPPVSRGIGYGLAAVSLSGFFALAGQHVNWHGSFEIGGMAGLLIATTLSEPGGHAHPAGHLPAARAVPHLVFHAARALPQLWSDPRVVSSDSPPQGGPGSGICRRGGRRSLRRSAQKPPQC
jgi:DNA segregation ATPase FtsK/SpoIIIE-like protein